MSVFEAFYKERLYPFQDGILTIVKRIGAPFYLTGGTAISRHYHSVRYSDDLDLFLNRDRDFQNWVEALYAELEMESLQGDFSILYDRIVRYEDFVQIFLAQRSAEYDDELILKIDLVNDVAPRYGDMEEDALLGRVDSWRNILSNKVSALYRIEPKDVVDLWALAKKKAFNWGNIFREASSKEAGLDPVMIFDLLMSFPSEALGPIKWIGHQPNRDFLLEDIRIMAKDIFEGLDNSLVK